MDETTKAPLPIVGERTQHHTFPVDIQGFKRDGKLLAVTLWATKKLPEISLIDAWLRENTDIDNGTYQISIHTQLEAKEDGKGVAGQDSDR